MSEDLGDRGLRILSLGQFPLPAFPSAYGLPRSDGGGIRGLSSLLIIENIMIRVKTSAKLDTIPKPCDYFDLIAGSSTGGCVYLLSFSICRDYLSPESLRCSWDDSACP
jgi:hypothetical protein